MKLKNTALLFAVTLLSSFPSVAQTAQGPTMIPQLNTDFYVGSVPGFYPSIQSAVTQLCALSSGPAANGSRVIVPAGSPATGTSGFTISAVTGGCVKVAIEDRRAIPPGEYLWTPTGPGSPAYLIQATGGGLTLGGATFEGQANPGSGTALLGNGLFSNSAKTTLTTQAALTAKQTNAVINSDLNSGVAATMTCAGCAFVVPITSTDVNPITLMNGNSAASFYGHDYRTSGWDYHQNVVATTTFPTAYGHICVYGSTGITTGGAAGGALGGCESNYFAKTGGGVSNSNIWTNFQAHQDNGYFMSSGQSFGRAYNYFFGKLGDSIIDESNSSFREGATGFSDEAAKFTAHHFIDAGNQWGTVNVAGANNTSTGIASVGVNITGGGCPGNTCLMDGGFLMFEDEPMDTTTITAQTVDSTGANLVTTSTTHAVSTWQATLTAPCGAFTHRDVKTKYDCAVNVTVNTANPTSGSVVSMVDGLNSGIYETAMVTTDTANSTPPTGTGAQTVVLWLSGKHGTGSKIMMGGTAGGVGTFANGLADPTTSPGTMTSWAVGGSPDATHEYIVTTYKQGQQGTMQVQIPPLIVGTTQTSVSCTGTSVTAPITAFQNSGPTLNIVPQGTEAFVAAGFSGAGMNGTVTNVHINGDGSASWTPPGGTCTAGNSSAGGTITVTNSQGLTEYCGTEVTAIVDATWTFVGIPFFNPNGTLHADPMTCTAALNERVNQPDRVEEEAQMNTDEFIINSTAVGNNRFTTMLTGGMGMSGVPIYEHSTTDNANPTTGVYFGHGGRNIGSVYLHEIAPNAGLYSSTFAPLNGGPLMTVGCPLEGCSATQPDTPILQINGANVNGQTQGKFFWQGAQQQWWFGFSTTAFGNNQAVKIGPWPTNTVYNFLTMNGNVGTNSMGFLAGVPQIGDQNLYHIMPSGGAETWRWNSLTVNTGALTATNFDYPSFSEGGFHVPNIGTAQTWTAAQNFLTGTEVNSKLICTVDGTNCPSIPPAPLPFTLSATAVTAGTCTAFSPAITGLTQSMTITVSAQANPGVGVYMTIPYWSTPNVANFSICAPTANASNAVSLNIKAQ